MISLNVAASASGLSLPAPAVQSLRTRVSPEEALDLVVAAAGPRPPQEVPLAEACGRRLAQAIAPDRPYPPFPRAMMDGYAVRLADAGTAVEVTGEVAAGQAAEKTVLPGQCLEIMTGAACPPGTEAVVQKEHVHREGRRVRLPATIPAGSHIAPRGSECAAGSPVLLPGDRITPLSVAVIASFGLTSVRVLPRPSLAVITTGAELVRPGDHPTACQIRDSNGPMLAALATEAGLPRPDPLHVDDRLEAIREALEQTAEQDIIVLSGGVSAGTYDLVPQAVQEYGAEIVFHKVNQKPGKPLLFARKGRQLLFGLPGNPLACHLGFSRYVAAAARRIAGEPAAAPLVGRLTAPVFGKGPRTFFCLARASRSPESPDAWRVAPLAGVSSADIFTPCAANSYVMIAPGTAEIPAGEPVAFEWIPGAMP